MYYLYLLGALLLQGMVSVGLAGFAKTRSQHPGRTVVTALGVLTFIATWAAYFFAVNHFYSLFPRMKGEALVGCWALLILGTVFCFLWSMSMFTGSLLIAACRIEDYRTILDRRSIMYKILDVYRWRVDICYDSNLCNISWSFAFKLFGTCTFFFLCGIVGVTFGLLIFLFTGKDPFRAWEKIFSEYENHKWETLKLFDRVPLMPAWYIIFFFGLYQLAVWLPRHIMANLSLVLSIVTICAIGALATWIMTQPRVMDMVVGNDPDTGAPLVKPTRTTYIKFVGYKTKPATNMLSSVLQKALWAVEDAGSATLEVIKYPIQILKAAKKGACPRIYID